MNPRSLLLPVCALVLGGCTTIDGVYLPACEAYSGSEIRLADGRFHWSKFTDQVVVDEDGNTIDPFPGFPLEGDYQTKGQVVTLAPGSGQPAETLYLHAEADAVFLLTAKEKAAMEAGGAMPECALRRRSSGT